MKKILFLIAIIAFSAMVSSCEKHTEAKVDRSSGERDSLMQIINQKNNELNDIMGTFNDIQDGFRQINEAEGRVTLQSQDPEHASTAQIMENIDFIKRTMQLNREMISRLKQQVKGSSLASTKLRETIENLTSQLAQKSEQIAQLQAQLAEKDIQIAEQDTRIAGQSQDISKLTSENKAKTEQVASQDKEIHTAWYVFGTKKELREQKILQRGDVLKTNLFNKDYFTRIDIRVDKVIKLYSKSASLKTSHPAGSYSLDKDAQGQYTLRITNPTQFWSISKYLVVVVK